MEIPSDWQSRPTSGEDDAKGHKENGRTLALHSLAVLPAFQNQGLGKIIIKSYMQRMSTSGVADRIALLAHDELVKYYERFGCVNNGKSEVTFGGGGWNILVRLVNIHRCPNKSFTKQYCSALIFMYRFMNLETMHVSSDKRVRARNLGPVGHLLVLKTGQSLMWTAFAFIADKFSFK